MSNIRYPMEMREKASEMGHGLVTLDLFEDGVSTTIQGPVPAAVLSDFRVAFGALVKGERLKGQVFPLLCANCSVRIEAPDSRCADEDICSDCADSLIIAGEESS